MLDTQVVEDIERFVEAELTCRKHPGSSLSVVRDGEVAWSMGFGYADIEKKVKAEPKTVYRCASVTKPVITVGLLQLMEKGKFDLDDEANDHLDVKIKDIRGEEPTIRDLLTHRSGMPTRVPPIYLMNEKPMTMRDYIESAARAVRPRGERYAYCNTAYMIAGYLIELFSGETYDMYVTENVLQPLEMNSSAFTLTPKMRSSLARGYKRAGGPEERLIANQQAEPFGSRCRVWAPVYRQSTLRGLFAARSAGDRTAALRVAYGDVVSAWRDYLARDNAARDIKAAVTGIKFIKVLIAVVAGA